MNAILCSILPPQPTWRRRVRDRWVLLRQVVGVHSLTPTARSPCHPPGGTAPFLHSAQRRMPASLRWRPRTRAGVASERGGRPTPSLSSPLVHAREDVGDRYGHPYPIRPASRRRVCGKTGARNSRTYSFRVSTLGQLPSLMFSLAPTKCEKFSHYSFRSLTPGPSPLSTSFSTCQPAGVIRIHRGPWMSPCHSAQPRRPRRRQTSTMWLGISL